MALYNFQRLIIANQSDIIKLITTLFCITFKLWSGNMFRNKEYILTVCQEGGFTKAAERLFYIIKAKEEQVQNQRIRTRILERESTQK